MAKSKKPRTILYRRKREQKTDYKQRLKLLVSRKPRLVVRFTNQRIIAQVISFDTKGDRMITAIDSFALKDLGWNYSYKNYPAAYLTGLLIGKKTLESGCEQVVLDVGFKQVLKKNKVYAFLKGVVDSGLDIPHSEDDDVFPTEEQISGKQIVDYAHGLKSKHETAYNSKFAKYLKTGAKPEQLTAMFEKIKQKILG